MLFRGINAGDSSKRASFVINLFDVIARSHDLRNQSRSSSSPCRKLLKHGTRVVFITLEAVIEGAHWWWTVVWFKNLLDASPRAIFLGIDGIPHPNLGAGFGEA